MLAKEIKPGAVVNHNGSHILIQSMTVQTPSARGAATLYKFRGKNLMTRQKADITLKGTESLDEADFQKRGIKPGDSVVDARGRYLGRVTSAAYAGSEQIVLYYGKKKMAKKGARIGIFPLPRNQKKLLPEPAKDELQTGDAVLLPVPAEVLSRFLGKAERAQRTYAR